MEIIMFFLVSKVCNQPPGTSKKAGACLLRLRFAPHGPAAAWANGKSKFMKQAMEAATKPISLQVVVI